MSKLRSLSSCITPPSFFFLTQRIQIFIHRTYLCTASNTSMMYYTHSSSPTMDTLLRPRRLSRSPLPLPYGQSTRRTMVTRTGTMPVRVSRRFDSLTLPFRCTYHRCECYNLFTWRLCDGVPLCCLSLWCTTALGIIASSALHLHTFHPLILDSGSVQWTPRNTDPSLPCRQMIIFVAFCFDFFVGGS